MVGNSTTNHSPLIRAQVYSNILLETLEQGFLPEFLARDVTDFGDGTTLNIPVLGETVIRDYTEGTDVVFDPIDSGVVTLTINQFKSTANSTTDKLKEDGYKAAAMEAALPRKQMYEMRKEYEADLLAALPAAQTAADPNSINGFAHRWVAYDGSTAGVMTMDDFVYAKLAFDKADVPDENRIVIMDPVAEAAFNQQVANQAFINNPSFEGIVNSGFAAGMRFSRHFMGFDIWVSKQSVATVTDTVNGGPHNSSRSVTDGKANLFLSLADDNSKCLMQAWRRRPRVEVWREEKQESDIIRTSGRWGVGVQRLETGLVVLTSASVYQ